MDMQALWPPVPKFPAFKHIDSAFEEVTRHAMVLVARLTWHMAAGCLRRLLNPSAPGPMMHSPSVWKAQAKLRDCAPAAASEPLSSPLSAEVAGKFQSRHEWTVSHNSLAHLAEMSIWFGCGSHGVLSACARNGWFFVISTSMADSLRPIRRGQAFQVHTRNVYWEDDRFYLHSEFRDADTNALLARVISDARITDLKRLENGRRAIINPRRLYHEMGLTNVPADPEKPELIDRFQQWDQAATLHMKAHEERTRVPGQHKRRQTVWSTQSCNWPWLTGLDECDEVSPALLN
ncbi:TPA: hypothetical protein N0F65_007692 [Lagenidium giganteum]|uniref:Uncharacterized protein n=1 Tax=Lagenidium giganteum TaxID=4803 RepID=A0AAV2YAN6_9STRA|nr:TPA: hypothetical protein N0F65_007692 [Lagenidium giganteum]